MNKNRLVKRAMALGCAALVSTTAIPLQDLGITFLSQKTENVMAATSTKISNLTELKAACKNGGVYTVTDSISVDEKLVVKKTLTLKGSSSVTIRTKSSISCLFEVEDGVSFTLDGGILIKGGVNESYYTQKAIIYANPKSIINVKDAKIFKSAGHALYLKEATLNITGGTITDNECRYGSDTSEQYGGAVFATGSTIKMTAGTISSNKYGGVYLNEKSNMCMSGGTISNNSGGAGNPNYSEKTHYGYGGAVYCNGVFDMLGGKITKNAASKGGYGIAVASSGKANLYADAVVNGAGVDANDVYLYGNGQLNINGKLSNNILLSCNEYTNGKKIISSTALTGDELASLVTMKKDGWFVKPGDKEATLSQKFYVTFIDTNTRESTKSDAVYYNDTCNMIEKERLGYTLAGWSTKDGSTVAEYLPGAGFVVTQDTTLYSVWTPKLIGLVYDYNGGINGPSSTTYSYDEGFQISSIEPTKEGYDFEGWYLNPDFTGTRYQSSSSEKIKLSTDEAVTLYAHWTPKKISITFNDNIAEENITVPNTINTEYDSNIAWQNINTPTRTGYEFVGWNTKADYTGKTFGADFNTSELGAYGDITLYAQWKEKSVGIQYMDNQGNIISTDTVSYTGNKAVATAPTKTGYTFEGWYTEKDGKGTKCTTVAPSANNSDKDIVLYANYSEKQVGVTFDLNGGTSATTTLTPIAYSKAVSEGFTLPAVAPQRAGYTFAGWYTNASFTGTAYTAGQILRNEPNNENNITLYAKWTENATVPSTNNNNNDSSSTNNNNSTTITDPEVPGSSSNNSNVVVVLNYNSKKLGVGESFSVGAQSSSGGKITYESSNENVASVSSNGKVTGWKNGVAVITATVDGASEKCTVRVYKAPTKATMKLSATKKTLKKGKSFKIKTTFKTGYYCSKVTYKSSNKKVAAVSSSGKVTAKKKGKATITVNASTGLKKTVKITVK